MKTALLGTQAERRHRETRARLWRLAGIPSRFADFTLDTSPVERAIVDRLRYPPLPPEDAPESECDAWRERDRTWNGSWLFWGAYGTGKTGLAVGYAREWLEEEWGQESTEPIIFRTVPRLLTELRASYGKDRVSEEPSEEDLLRTYTTCSLLILDDLGAEQVKNTGWVEDRLYQVIGERHDENRPAVFTSNLSIEALGRRIGERITWRIVEMCGKDRIVHMDGPNLRA